MSKFQINIDKKDDQYDVVIAGVIDEDVDFMLYSLSGAATVKINLDGIQRINSCGIREWIKWVATAQNSKIIYNNCPRFIIDQINMVQGFLPTNAHVESFYVPYYCEVTDAEENKLVNFGIDFTQNKINIPEKIKDKNDNIMEIDVIESKYFKFLKKV